MGVSILPDSKLLCEENVSAIDCAHEVARIAAEDIRVQLPAIIAEVVREEIHREIVSLFGADTSHAESMISFRRQQMMLSEISTVDGQEAFRALVKLYKLGGFLISGGILALLGVCITAFIKFIRG